MIGRSFLLVVGCVALIVHGIWPHALTINSDEIGLFIVLFIIALAPALESFSLPGGAAGKIITDYASEATTAAQSLPSAEELEDPARMLADRASGVHNVELEQATVSDDRVSAMGITTAARDQQIETREGHAGPGRISASRRPAQPATRLASVRNVAQVSPQQALVVLRIELMNVLRATYESLHISRVPSADYELVAALSNDGVLDQAAVRIVSAVLGAAEVASRARSLAGEEVDQLIAATESLFKLLPLMAAMAFLGLVWKRVTELAGSNQLGTIEVNPPGDYRWDFGVGDHLLVQTYYFPSENPGTWFSATHIIQGYMDHLPENKRALVVISENATFHQPSDERIRAVRLSDLKAEDLH